MNCTSKVININTTTSFVIYIIAGRYYYINQLTKLVDWFPYESNTGI